MTEPKLLTEAEWQDLRRGKELVKPLTREMVAEALTQVGWFPAARYPADYYLEAFHAALVEQMK